jgi:tyrosinase
LSVPQKRSYIDAVLCLTTRKAKSEILGTINRSGDHHAVHVSQSDSIHFIGHFLLWHHYLVDTYGKASRECGYTGGQPY